MTFVDAIESKWRKNSLLGRERDFKPAAQKTDNSTAEPIAIGSENGYFICRRVRPIPCLSVEQGRIIDLRVKNANKVLKRVLKTLTCCLLRSLLYANDNSHVRLRGGWGETLTLSEDYSVNKPKAAFEQCLNTVVTSSLVVTETDDRMVHE